MSADDQTFLDALSSVPNDIRKYSSEVADYLDRHLERASNALRDSLNSASWLPESARPRPSPPPPRTLSQIATPPASTYARISEWVSNHKFLTTVIVVAVGGVTYHIVKKNLPRKKRRAKKASNGARLEVVVIAGSPSEPLVRSISLDLERRGFIVYIVCNTIEEEILVQNESRQDIKPLMMDIIDPESAQASIDRFTTHLQTPHAAFQGAKPHHLTLRSLIMVPSTTYPTSPIATLPPSTLNDLLNTRLLTPILTLQTFLPLLTSLPLSHPTHSSNTQPRPKPSVLVLTPSIIPSLNPGFHAPESTLVAALTSFATVLRAELSPLNIPVTQLNLGSFDLSPISHSRQATLQSQRSETLKWDLSTREKYAHNYIALSTPSSRFGKGSSLRELNDAVFDSIFEPRGGVVRVGMGAGVYGFVGKWVPAGLIGWMLGVRTPGTGRFGVFGGAVKTVKAIENGGNMSEGEGSDKGEGSGSDREEIEISGPGTEGLGESGYVYPTKDYVYPQREDGGFGNRA